MLGSLLLYLMRFGYGYGFSDQDEILPYLLHLLDPSLFANDWFVQAQASQFNVRTPFVLLLFGLAQLVPVPVAVAVVYLTAWLGVAAGVFEVARLLSRSVLTASLTVPLVFVFTPQWTMGGNELVHGMLVPSMAAWALALWGVVAFLQERPVLAGLCLGLAAWMQALVGLQVAALLGFVVAATWAFGQSVFSVRKSLLFFFCFAITAVPVVGPLLLATSAAYPPDAERSLFYVMAAFRNPHHYLPHSFSAEAATRFGALAAASLAVYFFAPPGLPARSRRFVNALLLAGVLVLGAGYAGVEGAGSLFIAKLQPFKITVLLKVVLIVVLVHSAVRALRLRASWSERLTRFVGSRVLLALVLGGWALYAMAVAADLLPARLEPVREPPRVAAAAASWASQSMPRDARALVPPSWSSFRPLARRGIVVNFKAFPFSPPLIAEWFERLRAVAPIPLPPRGSPDLLVQLDAAYEAQPAEALHALARRYGATYLLRTSPLAPTDAWTLVYSDGLAYAYQLQASSP